MLVLDHVGARSGKRRITPLVYMPDGENFLIVAAKGGRPENPSWLQNLRAHPDTEIQIGSPHQGAAQGGRRRGTPAPVADGGHLQTPTGAPTGAATSAAPCGRSRC
jgi:deazaflavin-dependent oxidoreductase (nitroreductase family)